MVHQRRLWVTFAWLFAGSIIAQFAAFGALLAMGYSLEQLQSNLSDVSPTALMVMLGITQALSYLIPGIVAAYMLYRADWVKAVFLDKGLGLKALSVGLLILFLTLPLTVALAQLNASIDLADWQLEIESGVAETLNSIIVDSSSSTFVFAFLLIAVLPAVGEELVFRGLLQPAFIALTRSTHVGVWITALAFALVHVQFAGLVPRIFLGAVLGFLAVYSRRLWLPIIAHFVFNGTQVLGLRYGYVEGEAPQQTVLDINSLYLLLGGLVLTGLASAMLPAIRPAQEELQDRGETSHKNDSP